MFYMINNSTYQPFAYAHLGMAEEAGDKLGVDYSILEEPTELSIYSGPELVKIYNNLGHSVKKFSSKADGQEKIFKAFQDLEINETESTEEREQSTVPESETEDQPIKRKSPVIRSKRIRGVGDLVRQMILKDHAVSEIVEAAQDLYPENTTSPKDIAWWKWDMRNKGLLDELNEPTEKGLELIS